MQSETLPQLVQGEAFGIQWRLVDAGLIDGLRTDHLSKPEHDRLSKCRNEDRRRSWIAGRLVAKRLLQDAGIIGSCPWNRVEIRSADGSGKGIPPEVLVDGDRVSVSLSLSHSNGRVLAGICSGPRRIGVDLQSIAEVQPRALRIWMTASELDWLSSEDAETWTAVWALKEAAYKCVCIDEQFVPRRFDVTPLGDGWLCRIEGLRNGVRIQATTSSIDGCIAAIAVSGTDLRPRALDRRSD